MPTRSASAVVEISSSLEFEELDLGPHSSPDGAVTIFFSDIEGSSTLSEQLGDGPWSAVLQDHNATMRRLADSYEGAEVKAQGDGFMFAFKSAHAGLRCAIEVQRTFAAKNVTQIGEPLRVRIGLHSGYVIQEADDLLGRNVVLTARIADYARGGQILVSRNLREHTQSDPSFQFEHRGDHHFKGLLGEHPIYAVRWEDGDGAPPQG
jgi:eukaryotic-like serine/threonine-protein kinase